MTCKDQSITYLQSFGYNVVRVPRADIAPLQILTKNGSSFESLGQLSTVLVSGNNIGLPSITHDIVTSSISGQRTADLTFEVGISILGNIIGAMKGGKLGLEEQYKKAKTIAFEFENVLTDSVEVAALDQYLTDSGVNPTSKHLKQLLDDGDIFVITSVIKSNKISVSATAKDKNELSVDVPVIKEIVGGKVKIDASTDKSAKVAYTGAEQLIFGFKAVKLSYDMGVYTAFKPVSAGGYALKANGKKAEENWLIPEAELLNGIIDSNYALNH